MAGQKKNIIINRNVYKIIGLATTLAVLVLIWAVIDARPAKQQPNPLPHHTMPYVDGGAATDQVENFYRQYLDPQMVSKRALVEGYGNKNLTFYDDYYQHGFDPIVCSTVMPLNATATLDSTGPVAKVQVLVDYPDGTKAKLIATVVLDDGMSIDSITCPGDKGNYPRVSSGLQPQSMFTNNRKRE